VIYLDLTLITDRLASLQSGGTVDLVAIAATREAAIDRGAALPASVWVVPTTVDPQPEESLSRLKRYAHGFEVLCIVRELATAPDAGAASYAALRAIRQAVADLLEPAVSGWAPTGFEPVDYLGGAMLESTEQAIGCADQYEVAGYC